MIYARRFHWLQANPLEITALLDEFVAHPEFLSHPLPPDHARAVGADLLANQANVVWTTYSDRDLTGCVILTRILPRVDALLHFLFLDKDLASKRKLLRNLIGYCLTDLGFNRLSMECPEGNRIERFARRALGFRLEGEIRDRPPELPKALDNAWMAKQGSRREQSYFDGTAWKDIILIRVLASEWVDGEGRPDCRSEQPHHSCPSPEVSSAASSEAAGPVTPSLSSPKTSSPSDSRT